MAERIDLKTLKDDFSFLKDDPRVIGVLLFGSRVSGDTTRGDYDICVVSPESKPSVVLSEIYRHVDVHSKRYDVYTFEELPLYMKMEVISNHEIIFARDVPELYEYLYFFRKLWKEQEIRQNVSVAEMAGMVG
jgi:predicted nucleotidyltransferase